MSYIERARQNKVTAEKAAAFDKMQQSRREQDVYSQGTNDAYASVEQELMRRAAQPQVAAPQRTYGTSSGLLDEVNMYMKERPDGNTVPGLASSLLP